MTQAPLPFVICKVPLPIVTTRAHYVCPQHAPAQPDSGSAFWGLRVRNLLHAGLDAGGNAPGLQTSGAQVLEPRATDLQVEQSMNKDPPGQCAQLAENSSALALGKWLQVSTCRFTRSVCSSPLVLIRLPDVLAIAV